MSSEDGYASTDIAVVGLAGRFPRARDIDEFWERLRDGIECISRFTDEELRESGLSDAALSHPNYVKANAWLEDADMFDADFFGFSPREAEVMDPQHRIFLECACAALENAGYGNGYDGPVGVFAGSSMNSYYTRNLLFNRELMAAAGGYQVMIGNDKDFVATRVAYKLDLHGPAMTIQTACSTSLVAIQVACQSLLTYQSDMAMAGGVSVYWPQKQGYLYQEGMITSPDGHCRAFDANAQGTVGGQGVGIVVLKRLDDALRDGDTIHAIVKGSAINNDGSQKVGYTAPSVDGQAEVIAMAQAMAGVDPATITMMEAHGTATPLGDPIEVAALTQVFRASTEAKQFCALGSVKTNIGHLDAAAGVAGFIKATLALEHAVIPPSLHYEKPNPQIDFANSPFKVQTEATEWRVDGHPRRAGVSSFGIGGTNAHAVLEEAPVTAVSMPARPWQVLIWSAKTEAALEAATANLVAWLQSHPEAELADVAFTLQAGRKRFSHRRAVVARTREQALELLDPEHEKQPRPVVQEASERPLVFMFSGQGSQYAGMAAGLYRDEPTFRKHVDECAAILDPLLGCDLREVIFTARSEENPDGNELNQTWLTQPALFVLEYALAKLWMEWGVRPDAMIGHSIGEYTAACLAGVMSLEETLEVVALRGRLMQDLPRGSMLAVPAKAASLATYLDGDISIAAINGPEFCTLSGPTEQIEAVEQRLQNDGVECRRLHTSHAFHSAMMDPILATFTDKLKTVSLKPPQIPYLSNVTGTWISDEQATDPEYWSRHLRGAVLFADGITEVLRDPSRILLEVGPGKTLATFARQSAAGIRGVDIQTSLPHPTEEADDSQFVLAAVTRLWQQGVEFDWSGFHAHGKTHRIPLPAYPFERRRYIAEPKSLASLLGKHRIGVEKNPNIAEWFYLPSWKRSLPDSLLNPEKAAQDNVRWVIFADEGGVGERLAAVLNAHDRQSVLVKPGTDFNQLEANFTIDPVRKDHYEQLVARLDDLDSTPYRVLHLWSLVESEPGLQPILERGFLSLLYLAQALGERVPASVQIVIAASGLQAIGQGDQLWPEQSLLLGPAKVIPREYPYMTSRTVDMTVADVRADTDRAVQRLLAEFQIRGVSSVAYRGDNRWVQTFEPVRLDPVSGQSARLRSGGVYLVTGGLGGIGFSIACYLAESMQAKLILTGRSALPDRGTWDAYLAEHDETDSLAQKLRRVLELESFGADVMVVAADVGDIDAMSGVVESVVERFGAVNGVIHAAGVAGDGIMQLKTREAAESVLRPKVEGTMLLESLLKGPDLDFMILCSSINSIYGGAAVVDYAAANAFMDAFATARRSATGLPVISVNWDAWQDVGMAVDAVASLPQGMQAARRQSLKLGIDSAEGVDAFRRVLDCQIGQIVVATRDIRPILDSYDATDLAQSSDAGENQRSTVSAKQPESGGGRYERPDLTSEFVEPRNADEELLVAIWIGLLGIQKIGVEDDFFELGGHSLLGTRVLARIQEEFSLKLPLQAIFEAPTIALLTERIQTLRWASQGGDQDTDEPPGDVEEVVF